MDTSMACLIIEQWTLMRAALITVVPMRLLMAFHKAQVAVMKSCHTDRICIWYYRAYKERLAYAQVKGCMLCRAMGLARAAEEQQNKVQFWLRKCCVIMIMWQRPLDVLGG